MNNIYYPDNAIIRTSGGTFNLTISKHYNRDTGNIDNYTINLGGINHKCVQINIPSKTQKLNHGILIWVESAPDCSLESYIEKGLALHMTLLGFTISRDINPTIERLYFDDCSRFMCDLPTGESEPVSMKSFHIAFHGATWYEYYFDAQLVNNYDVYSKLKENLYKPEKKPLTFNFINKRLCDELTPLFTISTTWFDFFGKISEKYGKKKCTVVYPWIESALYTIFEGNNIFDNIKWYIDFKNNELKNKTPYIPFKSYIQKQKGSGKTKTRKMIKIAIPRPLIYYRNIPEIVNWDYNKYLDQ